MTKKYKNGNVKNDKRTKHVNRLRGLKFMSAVPVRGSGVPSGETDDNRARETDDNGGRCQWLNERRIIEFSVLLEGLKECKSCAHALQLSNILKETKMGLGSLFHIECEYCQSINIVASGKRHSSESSTLHVDMVDECGDSGKTQVRSNVFDVNTKLAAGNPAGVRDNILAIVPHVYGDHSKCGDWCKATEVSNYKHSYKYTGGNDLNNQSLRVALDSHFERYITDDMTNKLTNMGSTNSNENMNSMIARKAPKSINYSESESLESRISASVAQKNEGHQYILHVNEVHGLSPGKSTKKRCSSMDMKRRRKAERAATVLQKRRRLQLKDERSNTNTIREVEEGTTYASGVSHMKEANINEVPSAPEKPKPASVQYTLSDLVVFDLETTGGGNNDHIIQISARHLDTDTCFSRYVIPANGLINHHITTLTGLEYHGRTMFHNACAVEACEIGVALDDFNKWIAGLDRKEPVLVAHNASSDGRMLNNAFQRHSIINSPVTRYADTLPYFRTKYPDRKGKGAYTLSSLARDYVPGKVYRFHDADEDVRSLADLMKCNIDEHCLQTHFTSAKELTYKRLLNTNKTANIATYNQAVKTKSMSIILTQKLSESGLRLEHLQLVADRSGPQGVQILIQSRCGKSRFDLDKIMSHIHV